MEDNSLPQTDLKSSVVARIVDIDKESQLLVLDAGRKQGIKIGMKFKINRKGQEIGVATIMDIRSHIAGAFLHDALTGSTPVQVGDKAYLRLSL